MEVTKDGKEETSRRIIIKCGFPQGDRFSSVRFCLTEVPVAMQLNDGKEYKTGLPERRNIWKTYRLF